MKAIYQDFIVTLFGGITSLLTAMILVWIDIKFNIALYSLSVLIILPVGAIGAGFVAASGYYLGILLFQRKTSKLILLNMIAVSLGTYFLIHYLDYLLLEIDNVKISQLVTFWQYLDLDASNTAIRFRGNSRAIEIGNFGYIYALLQIIGFSIGGFALYSYLASKLFCENCSRYFSKKGSIERYTGNSDAFGNTLEKIGTLLSEHKFEEAIKIHASEGGELKFDTKNHHLLMRLILKYCKSCKENCLRVEVGKKNNNSDWDMIDDLCFNSFSKRDLKLT